MLKHTLLFFLLLTSFVSIGQSDWVLKKDDNNIQIYTRSVANESIEEYKAITVIDSKIDDVIDKLIAAPKYNTCLLYTSPSPRDS